MRIALAIMSISITTGLSSAVVFAEISEQDAVTIRMLMTAQRAAESAFPRARLKARVFEGNSREATVTAIWDGDKYFTDAMTSEWFEEPKGVPRESHIHRIQIRQPGRADYYQPDNHLLQRVTDNRFSSWSILNLRPTDVWLKTHPNINATHADLMVRWLKADAPWRISVRELSEGLIEVTSEVIESGDKSVTVFSMEQGGNVLSFRTELKEIVPGHSKIQADYEWLQVDATRWRLRKLTTQMADATDLDYSQAPGRLIEIDEFDPDPVLPANQFDIWSLNIPPGTRVEELGANERVYRLGRDSKPEQTIGEDRFRTLSDLLKSHPFARSRP